jgi:hypothetical protein
VIHRLLILREESDYAFQCEDESIDLSVVKVMIVVTRLSHANGQKQRDLDVNWRAGTKRYGRSREKSRN